MRNIDVVEINCKPGKDTQLYTIFFESQNMEPEEYDYGKIGVTEEEKTERRQIHKSEKSDIIQKITTKE